MTSIAIVDSSVLIAASNKADRHHADCRELILNASLNLIVPALCVAEAAYMIGKRRGFQGESSFVTSLHGFEVLGPVREEWSRIADLIERYSNLELGCTDSSLVVLAERLRARTIMTLDSHFGYVRPSHCDRFQLLPPRPLKPRQN